MDNRLYLSSDRTRIVEESDPDAAFVIASTDRGDVATTFGEEVADLVAEHLKSAKSESKARKSAPENKAVEAPAEEK